MPLALLGRHEDAAGLGAYVIARD
ncbi:uncharacterized protein G2W53_041015 [Senna tora]|uniref:Uncharacterized protein n=1 Tax=Senna tora TaxID=362788 RepID=A0A834W2I4_9FABA|nr:uncharacterized protein G2W53_041015 [Senna tora]